MEGSKLTPEQVVWLDTLACRHFDFYARLYNRMYDRRFFDDDPLFMATDKVKDAMRDLALVTKKLKDDLKKR